MKLITSYNYRLEMSLLVDKDVYKIPMKDVKSITINSDFDKNNMPLIYIGLSLTPKVYDAFIDNTDKGIVSFRLFKFDNQATSSIDEPYIEDKFTYVMTSNPNYNSILSTLDQTHEDTSTRLEGYIALVSSTSINHNRRLFNDILKNTDLFSVVHHYTHNMTMCIEPFDNNPEIKQIIIPPFSSLSNLLAFLNNYHCFYKTGYRYFRDFNVTYLLSNRGRSVPIMNTSYNSVIISIEDPISKLGNTNGIEIDEEAQAYIMRVNANSTTIEVDKLTDQAFNTIIGVDVEGNTSQVVLDIPKYSESTEKVLLERVYGNNLDHIHNIKHRIESSTIIVNISKTEIDSSILTPNKEFSIKHYDSTNSQYNGKYILAFKKEIMYQQANGFVGNVIIGLRKANEEG